MTRIIAKCILGIICVACSGCLSSKGSQTAQNSAEEAKMVGNDKDSHGCIASAGYQWSELLKDCIRPFEQGLRLSPVDNSQESGMACLVFSRDSSELEIYLPAVSEHPLLERQSDIHLWKQKEGLPVSVENRGDIWEVFVEGKMRYRNK